MTKEITIEFDDAREVMYSELAERVGEEQVEALLEETVRGALTDLYDRREQINTNV